MKRYIIGLAATLTATAAMAQETYESAQLATQDLNGTAKYVGMGGAMEALGADISTISSNPAGIGMFRKSWMGVSAGLTSQGGSEKYSELNLSKTGVTNADLNQIGFVYSCNTGDGSYVNMAVNYHKSRNFNQIVNAIGSLNDASVSKLTYMRLNSLQAESGWPLVDTRWNYAGLADRVTHNVLNNYVSGWEYDDDGNKTYYYEDYLTAEQFGAGRNNSGYISAFDFNLSGNINNRLFLGMTVGFNDVRYKSETLYGEKLVNGDNDPLGEYTLKDTRRVTGTGVNFKFGAIARPVEDSPFRIGLYINSPTWYSLKCSGKLDAEAFSYDGLDDNKSHQTFDYDYKIETPWAFGASLGHTISNNIALGVTYQYSDYSSIKNRIVEGTVATDYWYDSWYGDEWATSGYYQNSSPDEQMNRNTEMSLKGVHLLKAGIEVKPVPEVAIRAGYNYESAIYDTNGHKDMLIDAYYSTGNYTTSYDYINWKDTQRITFGLGFALSSNVNLDLSYQFSTQKGDYHPFQNANGMTMYYYDVAGNSYEDYSNVSINATPCSIKNNRHQVNATLSYRF